MRTFFHGFRTINGNDSHKRGFFLSIVGTFAAGESLYSGEEYLLDGFSTRGNLGY